MSTNDQGVKADEREAVPSWMPVKGPEMKARCPNCKGPLFAMLSDKGATWEAEKCFDCRCQWMHNPPKSADELTGKLASDTEPPPTTPAEADRVTAAELAEVVRLDASRSHDITASYHLSARGPGMLPRMAREIVALRADCEVMKADLASGGEALLVASREVAAWQAKCNSAWFENGALRAEVQAADSHLQLWERQAGPAHPLAGAVADARRMLGVQAVNAAPPMPGQKASGR